MDPQENKFSLDVEAEKQSLNPMMDMNDTVDDEENNFDQDNSDYLKPEPIILPIIANEGNELYFPNERAEDKSDDSLRVESDVTGINFSLDINSIETIEEDVSKNSSDIKNLSSGMSNMYNELYSLSTRDKKGDPFEERPTVLPTNLIFYNRIKRSVETNDLN